MTGQEGKIPLGEGLYIDTSQPSVAHYGLSDESKVSEQCPCDIEEMVGYYGHKAAAELCMRSVMSGIGSQESVVEIEINCKGPRRKLFGGKKCGAKIDVREVALPLEMPGSEPAEEVNVPEVLPGVTLASLVEDCIKNPDRSTEHDGLLWTDKVLEMDGVSVGTHIAAGSNNGEVVEYDIYQPGNPFTPPRITCDLSGQYGMLLLTHNETADEGGHREHYPAEERTKLEARAAELFTKYFVEV